MSFSVSAHPEGDKTLEFKRNRKSVPSLNLTPLIDIVFILIIFFMLTTSFMRVESLELMLPSASKNPGAGLKVTHLYIQPNGDMRLDSKPITYDELAQSLSAMLTKDPNARIMLLTADGVTVQQLVNIMDRVYALGGRSLFVRRWESPPPITAAAAPLRDAQTALAKKGR